MSKRKSTDSCHFKSTAERKKCTEKPEVPSFTNVVIKLNVLYWFVLHVSHRVWSEHPESESWTWNVHKKFDEYVQVNDVLFRGMPRDPCYIQEIVSAQTSQLASNNNNVWC